MSISNLKFRQMGCVHFVGRRWNMLTSVWSCWANVLTPRKLSKNKVSKQIVSTSGEPQTQLPLKIQDSERTEYVAPVSYTKCYVDVLPIAKQPTPLWFTLAGSLSLSLVLETCRLRSWRDSPTPLLVPSQPPTPQHHSLENSTSLLLRESWSMRPPGTRTCLFAWLIVLFLDLQYICCVCAEYIQPE